MPLAAFADLMTDARRGSYAVGYFESWNLESLLAAADAAEAVRSPVILGVSGIYLPNPARRVVDSLSTYAAMGLDICRGLSVPACLLFNESPHIDSVLAAVDLGFSVVMFSADEISLQTQEQEIARVVKKAYPAGVAVEAEMRPLPGVAGKHADTPENLRLSDPEASREFVRRRGIDALAVNIGQVHLHGHSLVSLDLDRLRKLKDAVDIPLVLHGASSVLPRDLKAAIELGIRKINVGSALKQAYFNALRRACAAVGDSYNPYEVIGSGLDGDVLVAARVALQATVEKLMHLFGSAGTAAASSKKT